MCNVEISGILEGAKLARTFVYEKALMMIFLKGGKIYGLDWCDGHGVTLCEYKQQKGASWSFQD